MKKLWRPEAAPLEKDNDSATLLLDCVRPDPFHLSKRELYPQLDTNFITQGDIWNVLKVYMTDIACLVGSRLMYPPLRILVARRATYVPICIKIQARAGKEFFLKPQN